MTRTNLAAVAIALSIAGCASSADPSPAALRQERVASWEKLCGERGFVHGTDDFRACVLGYDKSAYDPPPLK